MNPPGAMVKTFLLGFGGCLSILWFSLFFLTCREVPKKVDAGGHWLKMQSVGKGSPAVVLEIELSDKLQADLARLTRVVSYDRAGWRCSPRSSQPRHAAQIALELHTALANAKVPPPYLLVGDGMGGLFVRVFAATYPTEVCGLVLVDPDQEEPVPGAAHAWLGAHFPDELRAIDKATQMVTRGGKDRKRLEWEVGLMERKQLLENAPPQFKTAWTRLATEDTHQELSPVNIYDDMATMAFWVADEEQMGALSFEQARAGALPPIPVTLLTSVGTRPVSDAAEHAWLQAKRRAWSNRHTTWLAGIPGSSHTMADNSVDSIQDEEPTLLLDAIRRVLRAARQPNPQQSRR